MRLRSAGGAGAASVAVACGSVAGPVARLKRRASALQRVGKPNALKSEKSNPEKPSEVQSTLYSAYRGDALLRSAKCSVLVEGLCLLLNKGPSLKVLLNSAAVWSRVAL